jgi:uncharacterized protein
METLKRELRWRWTYYFIGILTMSLGITLTIKGKALGTSPWDVLHIGMFKQFGLSIGSWSILIGLFIILTTSLYLKKWPRLATWLNMLLIGSFIDVYNFLLPDTTWFIGSLLYFISGFFVMSIGCGLYISAGLGTGPRDTIMMIIAEKGYSVRVGRMVMEVGAVTVGFLLGGPVGVGTIILAVGTGYIIQPSLQFFQKRLAHKIDNFSSPKL